MMGASAAGVECLAGPYLEIGENHLRRVYGRLPDPGSPHGGVSVCLYYWDRRDGESLTGWWFGDSPGGEHVWARCLSQSLTPPQLGWRVPWDGVENPGLFELKFIICHNCQRQHTAFECETCHNRYCRECQSNCWDCRAQLCVSCSNWHFCQVPRRPRPWEAASSSRR